MYNNRELVPEHPSYFARCDRTGAPTGLARASTWNTATGKTLDVFPAPNGDARCWCSSTEATGALDKREHSFVAPAFTRDGTCVVIPNYALCPAVTVPHITLQAARAVAGPGTTSGCFGGDRRRITVAGHSAGAAGGHDAGLPVAAARCGLPRDTVRSALAISGLHDLEPIMRTPFLQPTLQLTREQVAQARPRACRRRNRERCTR